MQQQRPETQRRESGYSAPIVYLEEVATEHGFAVTGDHSNEPLTPGEAEW